VPRYPELRLAPPDAPRAARPLGAFRPTLVHVATPFGVGLAGRRVALRAGVPLVTSYHTSFSAYARHYRLGAVAGPAWRFLRWFHNGGRRTFVPTRAVAAELAGRGFRGLGVWGRGVELAQFAPALRSDALRAARGAREGDVVVAFVGRLAREKGLDIALDAVRLARRRLEALGGPTPRFVVGGDGPYECACRARAPEGTVFAGRLAGAALGAAYASADVFLFPPQTDTFGNVLLEALAGRCAVLAVDAPPTREVLADGAHGVIAPAASTSRVGARRGARAARAVGGAPRRRRGRGVRARRHAVVGRGVRPPLRGLPRGGGRGRLRESGLLVLAASHDARPPPHRVHERLQRRDRLDRRVPRRAPEAVEHAHVAQAGGPRRVHDHAVAVGELDLDDHRVSGLCGQAHRLLRGTRTERGGD
jgi:glycosyltransferase involved in cell wall biosynthesis